MFLTTVLFIFLDWSPEDDLFGFKRVVNIKTNNAFVLKD